MALGNGRHYMLDFVSFQPRFLEANGRYQKWKWCQGRTQITAIICCFISNILCSKEYGTPNCTPYIKFGGIGGFLLFWCVEHNKFEHRNLEVQISLGSISRLKLGTHGVLKGKMPK